MFCKRFPIRLVIHYNKKFSSGCCSSWFQYGLHLTVPYIHILIGKSKHHGLKILSRSYPGTFHIEIFNPPVALAYTIMYHQLGNPCKTLAYLLKIHHLMHPDPVLCRNTALNINIHDLLIGFIPAKSLLPISSTLPLEAAYLDLMSLSVNRVDIDKIFSENINDPHKKRILHHSAADLIIRLCIRKNKGMSCPAGFQRNLHSINRTQDIPSRFQIILRTFDPVNDRTDLTGSFSVSQTVIAFLAPLQLRIDLTCCQVIADNLIILIYDIHSRCIFPHEHHLRIRKFLIDPS